MLTCARLHNIYIHRESKIELESESESERAREGERERERARVRIRQHTSAYVSIRQHTSAYTRICWRMLTYADVCLRRHRQAYASIYTPAYIRQHISPQGWLKHTWEEPEAHICSHFLILKYLILGAKISHSGFVFPMCLELGTVVVGAKAAAGTKVYVHTHTHTDIYRWGSTWRCLSTSSGVMLRLLVYYIYIYIGEDLPDIYRWGSTRRCLSASSAVMFRLLVYFIDREIERYNIHIHMYAYYYNIYIYIYIGEVVLDAVSARALLWCFQHLQYLSYLCMRP
jgi:hypothetical protein